MKKSTTIIWVFYSILLVVAQLTAIIVGAIESQNPSKLDEIFLGFGIASMVIWVSQAITLRFSQQTSTMPPLFWISTIIQSGLILGQGAWGTKLLVTFNRGPIFGLSIFVVCYDFFSTVMMVIYAIILSTGNNLFAF
jgi:hypothetical protein